MEWINPKDKLPSKDLEPVLIWMRYFAMPQGEIMWNEEKKIEKHGYCLAYTEKGIWWDGRATINNKPFQNENIIAWSELQPPSEGGF